MFQRPADSNSDPGAMAFAVAGETVWALRCGALWWADQSVLVVSDLHLEKGSAYGLRGQLLPPYDTRATLDKVERLIETLRPQIVVSLGDSFHDSQARVRICADELARLRSFTARQDWIWIVGNHDAAPPDDIGGEITGELRVGSLVFRHEPSEVETLGEVCGHLHPCARVAGRSASVRTRCFVTDGRRLVMPAYGAYAGGLNVCDPAFAPLFPAGFIVGAIGRDRVYAAGASRLLPDAPQRVRA
jgi:uncharacterized protein